MGTILTGSIIISLLHALLPNHWLPIIAIGRQERWTMSQVMSVTAWAGSAHILSTLTLGLVMGILGLKLAASFEEFSHWFMPGMLVALGLVFMYRHHRHQHFHLEAKLGERSVRQITIALALGMFFSPCLEIEGYFLASGAFGWAMIIMLAILYAVVSLLGMLFWVGIVYRGLQKLNWHRLEHNAGLITGFTLIITGLLTFFIKF
jgi:nickel/cobalt exporter